MNSAAKSSTVRLYVTVVGLLSALVGLVGDLVGLLSLLVTTLTRWVQARSCQAEQARASRPRVVAVPSCPAAAPQGGRTAPAPTVYAPPDPAVFVTHAAPARAWLPTPAPVEIKRPSGLTLVPRLQPAAVVPSAAPAPRSFQLPSLDCLTADRASEATGGDPERLQATAALLVATLAQYGVRGTVEDIVPGPTVTTYEVAPAPGTKVSKVAALVDDLALALSSKVRVLAPIPGKSRIGFEVPNEVQTPVGLRSLVEDPRFQAFEGALPVVLGRDTMGQPVYADLATMPHVLVAGATGSGKSVGLNVMLTSLLYRRTPEELRMVMIDPKVVELAPFNGVPHMLLPVVTDMEQAVTALKWAVSEMERRYQLLAKAGTRNLASYNAKVAREGGEKLPSIVLVVDEFADLMAQQGKEVEETVARLAQKARAAGMHVILATQRPSADVLTGTIKANFPSRVAFRVSQGVDSRIILDEQGAEKLVGRGDMLVKLNGSETQRVQCPWVSEEDVSRVTDALRAQGQPVYDEAILSPAKSPRAEAPVNGRKRPALRVA